MIICSADFRIRGIALFTAILALLCALTFTNYLSWARRLRRNLSIMTYTFIVYGFSTITLIIYNVVLQTPFFGYPADHWWIFLALAIFPTFFGHTLFNWALKWLSTSTISMGIVFEPIGATILAYII